MAFGIYFYSKNWQYKSKIEVANHYNTYTKKTNRTIASYETTSEEFNKANIDAKEISKITPEETEKKFRANDIPMRKNRVLIGDNYLNYIHDTTELEMINTINPNWKKLLGDDLLNLQEEGTKVLVRKEFSVTKIVDHKGYYLEQVIITYLLKNGDQNSYRALVNSETGRVIETWDRTIHEKLRKRRPDLAPLPLEGIIVK